jgi:hypothetical protein
VADGLELETAWVPSGDDGRSGTLEFRILGPDGRAVRDFDEQHERDMHLMIVRRDLTRYRHLHPVMGADGTWAAPLTFAEPGVYRVFADFAAAGRSLTLGTNLSVPGTYEPVPLEAPADVVRIDGYEVSLDAEVLAEGVASLVFGVSPASNGRWRTWSRTSAPLGTWSLCARVIWPSYTCTQRRGRARAHESPSGRRSRVRGATASSCSSPTRAGSIPSPSPSRHRL